MAEVRCAPTYGGARPLQSLSHRKSANITASALPVFAYAALLALAEDEQTIRTLHLRDFFARDRNRTGVTTVKAIDVNLDYSKKLHHR